MTTHGFLNATLALYSTAYTQYQYVFVTYNLQTLIPRGISQEYDGYTLLLTRKKPEKNMFVSNITFYILFF